MVQSFFKALTWSVVFLLVGLAQLGATYILNIVKVHGDFQFTRFLLDGFFLFLAISLSCSIVYDFFMDTKIRSNPFWNRFGKFVNLSLMILFIGILLSSMLLYAGIYLWKSFKTDFNRDKLILCEQAVFCLAFIFTLGLKWIIYYNNDIKTSKNDIGIS